MNQNEVSRAIGNLEGDVKRIDEKIAEDERQNREDHRTISIKVDTSSSDVLKAIDEMEGRLNGRFDSLEKRTTNLETTVSISAAWFKAVKLVGYAIALVLMLKFGDAKDVMKEAWKALF